MDRSALLRNLMALGAFFILVYVGLCALLFFFQRSFLYFPQPQSQGIALSKIVLPRGDAELLITTRPHEGSNALIYFGGNAEDVSLSLPTVAAAFPDHAIYLMNYRGYGGSTGKPSEAALVADAVALYDKVRVDHENIVIAGRSLGSGIAVHLASLRKATRLILITPYYSIQELAANQFRYFPVRWLLRDKFESWKYAQSIGVPTLLIAAGNDEVIPLASTEALYAHFNTGVASLRIVAGAGHNTISGSSEYVAILKGSQ